MNHIRRDLITPPISHRSASVIRDASPCSPHLGNPGTFGQAQLGPGMSESERGPGPGAGKLQMKISSGRRLADPHRRSANRPPAPPPARKARF